MEMTTAKARRLAYLARNSAKFGAAAYLYKIAIRNYPKALKDGQLRAMDIANLKQELQSCELSYKRNNTFYTIYDVFHNGVREEVILPYGTLAGKEFVSRFPGQRITYKTKVSKISL